MEIPSWVPSLLKLHHCCLRRPCAPASNRRTTCCTFRKGLPRQPGEREVLPELLANMLRQDHGAGRVRGLEKTRRGARQKRVKIAVYHAVAHDFSRVANGGSINQIPRRSRWKQRIHVI